MDNKHIFNLIDKMLLKSRICVEQIINNYKKYLKYKAKYLALKNK
jgi:hypothetical protein